MNKKELKQMIKSEVSRLKEESRRPSIREKIERLAELNIRDVNGKSGSLTKLEEVERQFLSLTLPHVSRWGKINDLLDKLKSDVGSTPS